jgi:cytochrome c-type biogenesis protein CcmH
MDLSELRPNRLALALALAFVVAIFAVGFAFRAAQAQVPTPSDDQVNRIAHQLYCPVCENTPLDVCPTEACRQWRDLIRQQLQQGWSEDQIKQYFVEQYGARVLSEPPRVGLNWLIYVLPPAIILIGAFMLFRSFRAWTRAGESEPQSDEQDSSESPASDDYVQRLEDELRKRQ